jgi:fibronectin type 3 domain-containing protein
MKKLTLVGLLAAALLNAQAPTTRNVVLAWTASTSSGVTGYNVFRSASTTGPFTVPLNTTPVTATNYVDTGAVIGNTYTYAVTAVATACSPSGPVGVACGSSAPATVTTTIPPQPAITVTVVVSVP